MMKLINRSKQSLLVAALAMLRWQLTCKHMATMGEAR